jgi:hypothetical protein
VVVAAEGLLIDCTCVKAMHTLITRTLWSSRPSETHLWKEWLTQAPPIQSSVPKNRCQVASFRHMAKINSAVLSPFFIDPLVELDSTLLIAFRGLGNLLYMEQGRKLPSEKL